jgi:Domain of unknown function (DUF5071)
MSSNPADLMPRTKADTERAEQIVALGFPAIERVAWDLLQWTQDINWPVAQVLCPFFASVGEPLAAYMRAVFDTDDGPWKYNVLNNIIARSPELRAALLPELRRMALTPTPVEQAEEVHLAAQEVLDRPR